MKVRDLIHESSGIFIQKMKYKSSNFLLLQVSSSVWLIMLTVTKGFCKSIRKKYIVHINREKEIPLGMYIACNSQWSRRRNKILIFLGEHSVFLDEMCKRLCVKWQSSEEGWSTVVWSEVLFYTSYGCIKQSNIAKLTWLIILNGIHIKKELYCQFCVRLWVV